jgi:hypothetical protein
MPLHVSQAPAPAVRSVTTALGTATAVGAPHPAFLNAVDASLHLEHPLPVHVLEPEPPTGGLPQARLTGWRFLISDGERVVAAAETATTPNGWVFSHFSEGPYVASTQRALLQAESMPSPYEPRLLSIPGLYMLCLWLHGGPSADARPAPADVLIPLAPAPPGIAAHRPYRVADLLPLLTLRLTPPPLLGTAV